MAQVFGKQLTKREILDRVGNIGTLAGITRMTREDGRCLGMRTYEVVNGPLRFSVHTDKCMDLGSLYFEGMPLHFLARPGHFQNGWYSDGENAPRSIGGGMMFTCGLGNVGPRQDLAGGRTLPQHGRIRNSPAVTDGARCRWEGDEYILELFGEMREAELFGENLVLRRTITTRLGESVIHIHDEIENEGAAPSPLMLMYHCNAGYPLLDADSLLCITPTETGCRDQAAAAGMKAEDFRVSGPPIPGYPEQVFYHRLPAENGICHAAMLNPGLGLKLDIGFSVKELPYLIHWKCRAAGDYVTGIEPANCHPEGQARERENGTLRVLAPGEIAETDLWFTVTRE